MKKAVFLSFVEVGLLVLALFSTWKVAKVSAEVVKTTQGTGVAIGEITNNMPGYIGVNEIVIANLTTASVYILQDIHGVITQLSVIGGFTAPYGVAIGDFDNTAGNINETVIADSMSTSGSTTGTLYVYKYLGSFPLTLVYTFPLTYQPYGVAIGDLLGNGLNQLAVSDGVGNVYVYQGASLTLVGTITGLSTPLGLAIGDYDNVLTGLYRNKLLVAAGTAVSIWQYSGTTFLPYIGTYTVGGGSSLSDVAIGDYNNAPGNVNETAVVDNAAGAGSVTIYFPSGFVRQFKPAAPLPGATYWGVAIGYGDNDPCNTLAYTEWGPYPTLVVELLGDLGGGIPPTFYKFDGVIDGKDLALFLQCWHGIAPASAMVLADLGGGPPPAFFKFDNIVNGYDFVLFLRAFHGGGP